MKETELIQIALMLTPPWQVAECRFDINQKRLDIHLDFPRGSQFSCPFCSHAGCAVHDTERKSWRHLNFFQHEAYLHARVPRVQCPGCGVRLASVPWARDGSGFTRSASMKQHPDAGMNLRQYLSIWTNQNILAGCPVFGGNYTST